MGRKRLDEDKMNKPEKQYEQMGTDYYRLKGYNQACEEWEAWLKEVVSVEKIVHLMHNEYEKQAKIIGWKTQESCQVSFDELPEDNKKVMYATAKAVSKSILGD